MKITIPATSAKLWSLFSSAQKTQLRSGKNGANAFSIVILNTSAQIFYIEKGAAAVVGDSGAVGISQSFSITADNLNDWRVISASGSIDVVVTQLNT